MEDCHMGLPVESLLPRAATFDDDLTKVPNPLSIGAIFAQICEGIGPQHSYNPQLWKFGSADILHLLDCES